MAIVTIVNQLKSHIHVASINKVVAPGGTISMDSSAYEANAELKRCVQKGFFALPQSPAPAVPPVQDPVTSTVMSAEGPKQVEPFRMPEAQQAKQASARASEPPAAKKDEKSTVWTPDGPVFRKPFKAPEAPQSKRAAGGREVVEGVEILDLSGSPKTEKIDGIDVEIPDDESLGPQFIENDPVRSKVL